MVCLILVAIAENSKIGSYFFIIKGSGLHTITDPHKFGLNVDVRMLGIWESQEMLLVAQRLSPFTDPYKFEYKHPGIPTFVLWKMINS